jgi:hypothetical protein
MNSDLHSSRIAWLMANLAGRRHLLRALTARISGLGVLASLSPKLFRKVMGMLDEVAAAKHEENTLLSRIEDIEQKHMFLRRTKGLRMAIKAPANSNRAPAHIPAHLPERPAPSRLWGFVLWWMFLSEGINQKKQDLTAN